MKGAIEVAFKTSRWRALLDGNATWALLDDNGVELVTNRSDMPLGKNKFDITIDHDEASSGCAVVTLMAGVAIICSVPI